MNKISKLLLFLLLAGAGAAAFIQALSYRFQPVDQFYTVSTAGEGRTLATWYDDKDITIAIVDREGRISKSVTTPVERGRLTYAVSAACMGDGDKAYLLMDSFESMTGEAAGQSLVVYDMSRISPSATEIPASQLQTGAREDQEEGAEVWDYRCLNVKGSALSLIGVNGDATLAVRQVFEFGEVTDRNLNIKSERIYPLASGEGVFQAAGNGTDLVYISNTGRVYHAAEDRCEEIYPGGETEVLMYPLYLSYAKTGYVYIQDGESGDILRLNITDGWEETLMNGNAAFSSADVVTPKDICMMSMNGLDDFSAVISTEGDGYGLFSVWEGSGSLIRELERPITSLLKRFAVCFVLYAAAAGAVCLMLFGIYKGITRGKTIIAKLLLAALPLMVMTMSVFGLVAFYFYRDSVVTSYEKQTVDEGNMMTALFGQESFDALEYPYDYGSEDYRYLEEQMEGRQLYARVIYFEDGRMYTGVDKETPCFYPIGIKVNASLDALYKRAALSGEAVTDTVRDRGGERILSVTPIGGSSGRSVYLYETGIYTAVIENYQSSYIRNFVWICAAFLVVLTVLLVALFLQILQPLGEIREGMEEFTGGNRNIRIAPSVQDELAGICQAFNTMADDIDRQIVDLQNLSETYYRFMPLSIIAILGKDNLGNLTLGSHIQGSYAVLSVQFKSIERGDSFHTREQEVNQFFKLLNTQAVRENAVPIVDSANLSSILLICKEGVASAIRTALAILAGVDAYNVGVDKEDELDIAFLLHRSDIFVGICGDEERYIPVLITPELESLLEHKEVFMQVGSRLLVTGQAYSELGEGTDFESRYIGQLGIDDHRGGFYEFYGDRDTEEARRIKITTISFRKAMKLFEEGYLYEAKNLFSMVLQDNPEDMVVRYYIFRCG